MKIPQLELCAWHGIRTQRPARGWKKIGPFLHVRQDYDPNMQAAFDTDCECGVHWVNNQKSDLLSQEFPTVVAMSLLIEKERNRLRHELKRLQRKRKGKQ